MKIDQMIQRLEKEDRQIVLLEQTAALLQWDEETGMPPAGHASRVKQISLIDSLVHERRTDPEFLGLLNELAHHDLSGLTEAQRALVRLHTDRGTKSSKVPADLVARTSEAAGNAQNKWVTARKEEDFASFAPALKEVLECKKLYCQAVGYQEHPYDVLLDDYEPQMLSSEVDTQFSLLSKALVGLLDRIRGKEQPDDSFLYKEYAKEDQDAFGRMVLEDMGFDFERGVMEEAVHPFTTVVGADDVRITTRYSEPSVASALYSTIHEGGHALYELGACNDVTRGSSLSEGVSLSVHESQSRLWENIIGRSEAFWDHYYPKFSSLYPSQLEGVSKRGFVRGLNKVSPSFIRVNADEVTYSLHVILRYELEKLLVTDSLTVDELPDAWRELSGKLLGIIPERLSDGVLQDVHWSAGLVGYFPTYALGNLFGAQFYATMASAIPDLEAAISRGELSVPKRWLEEHIYQHGKIHPATGLLEKVTGDPLDASFFVDYLDAKYSRLYDL